MRIISKFSDYYDCMMHQVGMDKRVVYMRKTNTVPVDKFGLDIHGREEIPMKEFLVFHNEWVGSSPKGAFHWDHKYIINMTPILAGVAGVTHPGMYIMYYPDNLKNFGYTDGKEDYIWDPTELKSMLEAYTKQNTSYWHTEGQLESASKDFLKFQFDQEIYHEMNAPIIVWWGGTKGRDQYWHSNVELRQYKFVKKMDVYTIFQEIQGYVSGVLQSQENNTVEVSNQSKIDSHGYDKWSFRKHKDDPKVPETKKMKRKRNGK